MVTQELMIFCHSRLNLAPLLNRGRRHVFFDLLQPPPVLNKLLPVAVDPSPLVNLALAVLANLGDILLDALDLKLDFDAGCDKSDEASATGQKRRILAQLSVMASASSGRGQANESHQIQGTLYSRRHYAARIR